jgi:hypothetical protein
LLRERVLDPLILFILARNGRTPIHASGFMIEDMALLLAGPSGAGKSCLALAADRAGHRVLSDDTVYVQRKPHLRIWAHPIAAHLLPPDAAGMKAQGQRLRSGRMKAIVPFRSDPGEVSCARAVLCILSRDGEPGLRLLRKQEALARLQRLDAGFDLIAEEVRGAYADLCAKGAWELALSRDAGATISHVGRSVALLRQVAVP